MLLEAHAWEDECSMRLYGDSSRVVAGRAAMRVEAVVSDSGEVQNMTAHVVVEDEDGRVSAGISFLEPGRRTRAPSTASV